MKHSKIRINAKIEYKIKMNKIFNILKLRLMEKIEYNILMKHIQTYNNVKLKNIQKKARKYNS